MDEIRTPPHPDRQPPPRKSEASERRLGASDPVALPVPVTESRVEAQVRDEDLEPHEGLRYIARLFKMLAILLILMLFGEVAIGLAQQGDESIPTLVIEATRLIVFACFLWGAGDIALMQIESNHDMRATRILMGRLNSKMQRMVDIEADELELLAANPSLRRGQANSPPAAPPPG